MAVWPWRNNSIRGLPRGVFSWIVRDQIAAMAMPVHDDLEKLRAAGVSMLVSAVPEPFDPEAVRSAGMRHLHLPIEYWRGPNERQAMEFVAAAREELEAGGKVVVHCIGGIGRTGCLIASYLVSSGMDPEEAIALVRRRRPGSVESVEQENAVYAWAAAERRGIWDLYSDNGNGDGTHKPVEPVPLTSEVETDDVQQAEDIERPALVEPVAPALPEERDTTMAEAMVRGYLQWGTNGSDVDIRALSAGPGDTPRVEDLKSALREYDARDGVTVTLTEVLGRNGEAWVSVSCAPGRQSNLLIAAGEIIDQLVRANVYDEVLLSSP